MKLTELSLGKNIKLIGNAAFTNTGLKKVDLPEGLKSVGGGAFHTVHITEDSYMVGVEPEGMYEVHIPKSLKKIGCCAFANASVVYAENVNRKLLMACVQSGNMQRYHVARFWRLKVKDKPELILPKNIESPELAAQEINEFLNTDGRKIPHLYKYGRGNTTLAAALEHCRLYTDRQTKAFLTRHASEIAGIYSGEVEEFAKYIHAGVFTNIALKKMFAELEANKKERDDLSLKEIGRAAFCNAANIYTKEANLNAVRAGIRSSGASLGHGCDFWKLHIDGLQPIVMPKEVDSINVIARRVRLYTKGETTSPPETYSESRLATKYATALEHRKLYPGKDVDEFLTENIKKVFAFTIAEKDGERLMAEYIKSGMFTYEALQSLIAHIEKSNDFSDNASKYTALKAYALQVMKPSQDIFEI